MTVVTPAERTHAEAIAGLAEEMDRFYGATEVEPHDLRLRQINDALFGQPSSSHALLAWNAEQLVGFAAYSFLWPAIGLTRSVYLKELYVCQAARRQGVGMQLMHNLCEVALKHDCTRVEWTTDEDNETAQRFYDELGIAVNKSKLFYRIEGHELSSLAVSTI